MFNVQEANVDFYWGKCETKYPQNNTPKPKPTVKISLQSVSVSSEWKVVFCLKKMAYVRMYQRGLGTLHC